MPVIIRTKSGARFVIRLREVDRHKPHVHVEFADKEAVLFFDGSDPIVNGFSPREMRIIKEGFESYKDILKQAWDEYHG